MGYAWDDVYSLEEKAKSLCKAINTFFSSQQYT
jgi:hypothetical protein